ncbi:hypothetical protein [Sphingopyxis sp. JAI128]|uniref:hypothetical protein n=1 Tax=Sphingopyxis sp. JAI128 TaxID=2723066 RepID=UPI00161D9019|nr:hypothetical protein [Sphingopyxis sp. JAI128]MBB6427523.1 hypothetical protein [Sphingopyxis sp. JAI128]
MITGAALASRAIGDTARRDLASEWGGPEPGGERSPSQRRQVVREAGRRVTVRKP